MVTIVLRVWIPDRPGALGAVATRIGSVHGDVVGIDIVERGAGRAVDDLVVVLPDEGLLDLLMGEVHEVEGVDVEDVRVLDGPPVDPTVQALELAVALRSCVDDGEEPFDVLVTGARGLLHADWVAVVDEAEELLVAADGVEVPSAAWLSSFSRGILADGAPKGLDDLAAAPVGAQSVLILARRSAPLRGWEREVLAGLAALVGPADRSGV